MMGWYSGNRNERRRNKVPIPKSPNLGLAYFFLSLANRPHTFFVIESSAYRLYPERAANAVLSFFN